MASFSFSKTKIALTLGAVLGISLLTSSVIGLSPNQITKTYNGSQQPPPMSSLLEECGNFYWFDEDLIEETNGDIDGTGVVIPVTPVNKNIKPLDEEEAFRYYKLAEIGETVPTVDELITTALHHEGFIIWYMPSAPNDFLENISDTASKMDENIIIAPWTGGVGGEDRQALPQNRNFGYMSYNQITQSCNMTEPLSFINFTEYANSSNL